jgi:hypothetical protein
MTAMSIRRSLTDRLTVIQIIRRIFERSPVFQDAIVSEPRLGPGGEVIVDVSFERGPAAFRVVAPSPEEAYAILHELATAMVEVERSRNGAGNGHEETEHGGISADLAG